MREYCQPTPTIDSDSEEVREFSQRYTSHSHSPREQAVNLYYGVRDGIIYDPYTADLSVEGLRASTTIRAGRGWCVAKAILLTACCRSLGLPARLGFADVRNHLSTERMRKMMNDDPTFFWHGYTAIHLDGIWLKATPAFNIELCQKFQLKPLDFNGREDALFHSSDLEGNQHMEYIQYRGEFADVPIDRIKATFEKRYPLSPPSDEDDFGREVDQETSSDRKEK